MAFSRRPWGDSLCDGSWLSWGWGLLQLTGLHPAEPRERVGGLTSSGADSSQSLLQIWLRARVSQKWKPRHSLRPAFPGSEYPRSTERDQETGASVARV